MSRSSVDCLLSSDVVYWEAVAMKLILSGVLSRLAITVACLDACVLVYGGDGGSRTLVVAHWDTIPLTNLTRHPHCDLSRLLV